MTSQNEEEQPTNLFSEFQKLQSETDGIREVLGKKANVSSAGLVSNAMLQEIHQNQQKFQMEMMEILGMMRKEMKTEIKEIKAKIQREMAAIKKEIGENYEILCEMRENHEFDNEEIRKWLGSLRMDMIKLQNSSRETTGEIGNLRVEVHENQRFTNRKLEKIDGLLVDLGQKNVHFFIETPSKSTMELKMTSSMTVRDIKQSIVNNVGGSIDDFYLSYRGQPLDDMRKTLEELRIINDSVILMKLHGQLQF